jgi:RNA-directed DNA polymerase
VISLSHSAILTLARTSPRIRRQLKAWLKAGVVDHGELFPTPVGTIQGGNVSPLLINIALHGLETLIGTRFRRNGRTGFNPPRVIRYADDIVILHRDEQIVRQCQELVRSWLSERGLALKPSKTRITHTLMGVGGTPGFEFLGFAIRHYPTGKTRSAKDTRGYLLGYKTRIVPSPGAIQHHVQQLRTLMKSDRHASQEALIRLLNPGFCRKFQFSGQNPKIGYQKFNDLQTPKLSKKQICDRTLSCPRLHIMRR